MSLIMDALKKAQQLQLKGSEKSPILKVSHPDQKRGKGSKKQWIPFAVGLVFLCIVLFILIKPASPPLATQSNQTMVLIEKKPSVAVADKISPELPKEVSSPAKDEKSLTVDQALNRAGSWQAEARGLPPVETALGNSPSPPQGGLVTSEIKPSLNEKRGEVTIRQAPERERLKYPKEVVMKKSLPVIPSTTPKEDLPSKPIGVEQEGGKDRTLISEILNHFNSGVHFYNQREFSKAIQAYQKVIELDRTYVEAYNNLGIIYQMLGEMDKAFGFYQKSTEINPRYEKGYNNLGILLFLKGHYEEAQEVFQKALAINPNNIESHINLGILFKKKGQWEKAVGSYQKALAINPLNRETHYNLALLYEQLENLDMAITHYQQFIQLSSKSYPELVSKVQRHLNHLVEKRKNIEK
jgi:Tfp pilus assembly protein PilF